MEMTNNSSTPVITKETKNKLSVDYEGKLTVKERLLRKLKESNTWIKAGVNVLRFILMLGISFVIIYPFIARIAGSFMTYEDVIDSTVAIIPKNPTIEIYKAIIAENHYFEALLNTVLLSLIVAIIQTIISCCIGYGVAKFKFKGNKIVMALVIFTMIVPHNALSLSMKMHFAQFDIFNVITWGNKGLFQLILGHTLSLTNTFVPYIIMSIGGLAFKNGLYIYLMRQFFKGVPDELEESAYVDGSGVFRTFFQIILPLSVPMMITIFLFAFSWQWTDEFYASVFLPAKFGSANKVYMMPDVYQNIPNILAKDNMAGSNIYYNVIQNTGGMMIIMPLIILYLFCQKYLVQGIERSGLVG
ncbi:MAG: carbohydrate ABC transporter permease [Clostridia bacterium]|nr:carbohydrate ABC transporter permease [Clostridia bacterium]